jgi:hypothetical protein
VTEAMIAPGPTMRASRAQLDISGGASGNRIPGSTGSVGGFNA